MKRSSINGMSERARLQGKAKGALFYSGFGFLWVFNGLEATQHASTVALATLLTVVVLLLVAGAMLMRRANSLPAADALTEYAIRSQRMFLAVNIIQWVSIVTAISILLLLHITQYIATAVGILVGLHLFPLAEAFHNRLHYVTGALLLVWSLACLAMMPIERVMGVTSLGVGIILLLSAAAALLSNFSSTPRDVDVLQTERIV